MTNELDSNQSNLLLVKPFSQSHVTVQQINLIATEKRVLLCLKKKIISAKKSFQLIPNEII